ncbi:MAG: hypothetical protein LBS49_12220 [Candidatus Accumulibacter sp.]|nr:hypothetical protein [Accumulibacter sp.]
MTTATQRIPVLVTPAEKSQIAGMAKDAGVSMGEYFRRAAMAFRPSEDEKLLENMIEQMNKTTAQANAAIDEALAFVEASNQRIAAMEREAGQRKAA